MAFNAQAEAAAIATVVAKQEAQYKPAPRRFASLASTVGVLYAVASDGTAWVMRQDGWAQVPDLPAVLA
jgi:hypothetical protein